MSILQTVRNLTRSKHDVMENLIGSDRLSDFSIQDYRLLMSTNFLFHSHLEHHISLFLSLEATEEEIEKLNFVNRIKTVHLKTELEALLPSSVFEELKLYDINISFSSFENLLGWIYVAEGSMLGGKMMHKILSQNKEISPLTEFEFYANYSNKTSALWKSLKELVEEKCVTENAKEQFLNGAEQSYTYFENCFYKARNSLKTSTDYKL